MQTRSRRADKRARPAPRKETKRPARDFLSNVTYGYDAATGRLFVEGPAPIPKSPPRGRVGVRRRTDTYSSSPGSGLTPEVLVSVFRAANNGMPWSQYDLYEELPERDGHLWGLIEGRVQAVASKPWALKPGDESHAGSRRAAADLEQQLRRTNFHTMFEHWLMGRHWGFAAVELEWGRVDNKWMPIGLTSHASRRFRGGPTPETIGVPHFIVGEGATDMIELERGRWMCVRGRGRNVWRSGTLRPCSVFSAMKGWQTRDWLMFGEKFGIPLPIGFYDENASDASREALEETLAAIGDDGYAVLADTTEVVIKEAVRSGDATSVYPAIIQFAEAQQSKAMSGGVLNTDAGGAGSYALGSVHETRSFLLSLSDMQSLADAFAADIAAPFIEWNNYGNAAPPRLTVDVGRDVSLEVKARVVTMLVQAGMPLSLSQQYEDFGQRPPINDADRWIAPAKPSSPPPAQEPA